MDSDPANPNAWNYPWYNAYANVDIYSEMFKSSVFSQEHNVSVNGGSEKVTYYASFNYLDQGGLLEYGEDGLSRYNVAAKINANITKWLKFNYSTRFTRNDVWRPTSFNSQFYDYFGRMTWPNMPMYDPNGYPYGEVRNIAEGGQRDVQTDRHYHQATLIIEPIKIGSLISNSIIALRTAVSRRLHCPHTTICRMVPSMIQKRIRACTRKIQRKTI